MPLGLSILYSQDGYFWVHHFKLELNLEDSVCLQEERVEELCFPLKPSKIQDLSRCRASVVIITRGFLEFLETRREIACTIVQYLRPSTTVALLLGVTEREIQRHKTTLVPYHVWSIFVVKEGESLPLQAVRTIRNMFGRLEGTAQTRENNTTEKNTGLLQLLKKTGDNRKTTMKNTKSSQALEEMNDIRKRNESAKNAQSLQPFGEMDDIKEKKTVVKNTESSQVLSKTGNAQETQKTAENTKSFHALENGHARKSKTSAKLTESLQTSAKTDDVHENKATTKNEKSLQGSEKTDDVRKRKMTVEYTKSFQLMGKADDIQEKKTIMENIEPSQALRKTDDVEEKTTIKNAGSSGVLGKAVGKQQRETTAVRGTESYQPLDEKDYIIEGKKMTMDVTESFHPLEKTEDVQEKMAMKNTDSVQKLEKKDDMRGKHIVTEILMVPQKVEKEDDCVYLILNNLLNDIENTYVFLERNIIKEARVQKLNPYVIFFSVPEQFFDVEGLVNVHIWYNNQLLAVKRLHIVGSSPGVSHPHSLVCVATSPFDRASFYQNEEFPQSYDDDEATVVQPVSREYEEQACDGNGSSKVDEEVLEDDIISSILKLWAQYELDEWACRILAEDEDQEKIKMSTEETLDANNDGVTENVSVQETLLDKGRETSHTASFSQLAAAAPELRTSDLRKSEPLPSTFGSADEMKKHSYNRVDGEMEDERDYLDMTCGLGRKGRRPHEILLEELEATASTTSRQSSFSSHIYVSMKLCDESLHENAADNNLSESQQELLELLQAYKNSDKSLPEVERLFQEWLLKHQGSVDDRDVVLRHSRNETQKERKRESFGLTDLVRIITGKPKKKNSKAKAPPQDGKGRPKQEPKDKALKRASKISTSSVSSARSSFSDASATPSAGIREGLRDSGNHSDSNEDNKNKPTAEAAMDDRSTNWFLPLSPKSEMAHCPLPDAEKPPSLPSRPPPRATSPRHKLPDLPSRPPPKLPNPLISPPVVPPKPAFLSKVTNAAAIKSSPAKQKKKIQPKADPMKPAKKPSRDSSPEYIIATNHPRSPPKTPKTGGQLQPSVGCSPDQARRTNYVLRKLQLTLEQPYRKASVNEMTSGSNSSRCSPSPGPTLPNTAVSPRTLQKEHHSRFRKALIPGTWLSTSCPDFLATINRENNVHTYLELLGDSK